MEYTNIIVYMLLLSDFFKNRNESNSKETFLLLEPIIINIFGNKKLKYNDIISKLSILGLDDKKIMHILNGFHSMNIISRNYDDIFYINDSYNEIVNYYNEEILNKEKKWNKVKNLITNLMKKLNCNNIDEFNIDEELYNFLSKIFEKKEINQLNELELDIAIFLEYCSEPNKQTQLCLEFIKDILLGIGIINAVKSNNKFLNNQNTKLPIIYLDNIFVGSLLGWCHNVHYRDCFNIFNQLKNNNFEIRIHKNTFIILIKSMKKYKQMRANNLEIKPYTFFHFMQFCDKKNKMILDVDSINMKQLHNKLQEKLNKLNIIVDGEVNIEIDELSELYKDIEEHRRMIKSKKEKVEILYTLPEEQTKYDYEMINRFNTHKNDIDTLTNIPEIFLTFQQTILKLVLYDSDIRVYNPIMHVRQFSTLLLIENIILNINNNSKLLEYVLYESYSTFLSKKTLELLESIKSSTNIDDDQANTIVSKISCSTCEDVDVNISLLKNENNKEILASILKYKEKEKKWKVKYEELNNDFERNIEEANIKFLKYKEEIESKFKQQQEETENKLKQQQEETENKLGEQQEEAEKKLKQQKEETENKLEEQKKTINKQNIKKYIIFSICFFIILCFFNEISDRPDLLTEVNNSKYLFYKIIDNEFGKIIVTSVIGAICTKIIDVIFSNLF